MENIFTLGIAELGTAAKCTNNMCGSKGFDINHGANGENGGIGGNGGKGGNGGDSGFVTIAVNNLHGDVMYRRIPGDGGHGGQNGVGGRGGEPGKDSFGVSYDASGDGDGGFLWTIIGDTVTKVRFIYTIWSSLLFTSSILE